MALDRGYLPSGSTDAKRGGRHLQFCNQLPAMQIFRRSAGLGLSFEFPTILHPSLYSYFLIIEDMAMQRSVAGPICLPSTARAVKPVVLITARRYAEPGSLPLSCDPLVSRHFDVKLKPQFVSTWPQHYIGYHRTSHMCWLIPPPGPGQFCLTSFQLLATFAS